MLWVSRKRICGKRNLHLRNSRQDDSFLEHGIGGNQEADIELVEEKTEVVTLGGIELKRFCSYSTVSSCVTSTMTL